MVKILPSFSGNPKRFL